MDGEAKPRAIASGLNRRHAFRRGHDPDPVLRRPANAIASGSRLCRKRAAGRQMERRRADQTNEGASAVAAVSGMPASAPVRARFLWWAE